MSALETWLRRIGRHGSVYGAGLLSMLLLGLATVAVLTRLLGATQYGHMALLLFFSGALTIIYNLGSLQGTTSWMFRGGGDDDAGGDLDDAHTSVSSDTRLTFFTGLVLTIAVAGLGTAICAVLAEPLARGLVGDGSRTDLVMWAAAAGGLGSVLRLMENVIRYGRRPVTYVVINNARPLFMLAAASALAATGHGLAGVLAGFALGTAGAVLVTLIPLRNDLRPRFSFVEAWRILKRGRGLVPVTLSHWTILNADIFLLSLYAPAAQLALYRVAGGIARVGSYAVAMFTTAWGPLTNSPLQQAVNEEQGAAFAGTRLLHYSVLAGSWLLLGLAVFGDVLVELAPSFYAGAAGLIPLLAATFVARGWLMVTYRISPLRSRRKWYISLTTAAVPVFVVLAFVLIPPLGAYGAALASVLAMVGAIVVLFVRTQLGPEPLPLRWPVLLAAIALAGLAYAVARQLGSVVGPWRPLVEVAIFLAYPLGLVLIGAVPRSDLRPLRRFAGSALPSRRAMPQLYRRLEGLDAADLELLDLVIRRRRPLPDVARELGERERTVEVRLIVVLRLLGDGQRSGPVGWQAASYLAGVGGLAARASEARRLVASGVDALTLDRLDQAATDVRRVSRRRWRALARRARPLPGEITQGLPPLSQSTG